MKKFLLFLASLILSMLVATFVGKFYFYLFPLEKGGGVFSLPIDATNLLRGFTLSYFLLLTLFFTAFGGAKKYWYIGPGLIPAILFEVAFDWQHIYFPVALGLIAWVLGRGLGGLIKKLKGNKPSAPTAV